MRFTKSTIALLAILASCSVSHAADILENFTFTGTILTENKNMTNTGTVTGSVVLDVTNPTDAPDISLEKGDFTATYDVTGPPATDYSFTFTGAPTATEHGSGTLADPYYYVLVYSTTTPSAMSFDLDFIDAGGVITVCQINTNGFSGNGLCDQSGIGEQTFLDSNTLPGSPGDADLVTGSLTPTTPEPSSLILLGTGLLGLAASARRRFAL